MTPTPHSPARAHFVEARARAEWELSDQQRRAVRTVASQARDRGEFSSLLSMLGLEDPTPRTVGFSQRLAVYVDQVATALGVPPEAIGCEVSDTATAYVGLERRWTAQPDRDLMLVWDEHLGWYLAVETTPAEPPVIVAYLHGAVVAPPDVVARFVRDTTAGRHVNRFRPVLPLTERTALADLMAAVT